MTQDTNLYTLALAAVMAAGLAACSSEQEPAADSSAEQPSLTDQVEDTGQSSSTSDPLNQTEVIVLGGFEESLAWFEQHGWWAEAEKGSPLSVPNAMVTAISPTWNKNAAGIPVSQKKDIFYSAMLPMALHANGMVMLRRELYEQSRDQLLAGQPLSEQQLDTLRSDGQRLYKGSDVDISALAPESEEWMAVIDELLYRVDIVPAGLVLGQAAYESGYGTSRFATEGNSLFGQWTYGGEGIKPEQQREELGDHRIAAFDWPFDSVRGYFLNLMSHPAYEDFRRIRAERRAAGLPVSSLALADGLVRYSERGQEYVDDLKGIISFNKLERADDAELRDEAIRFFLAVESPEAAAQTLKEIESLRETGELAVIIDRMNLGL